MVVDVKVVDEIALPLVVNIPFSEMVSRAHLVLFLPSPLTLPACP
jgi:hypothetical protein